MINGKFRANLSEEIPQIKLYVNLIGTSIICSKGNDKDLIIKYGTIIDPVMVWSKIPQYDNKCAITTRNLAATTWLTRYPWPTEIRYNQGSEFIVHGFKNLLIQKEYIIKSNPSSFGNPTSSLILETIRLVLYCIVWKYNLQQIYVYKNEPWVGMLSSAALKMRATANNLKSYTPVQLIFVCDLILPIIYNAYWLLIYQQNQSNIVTDDNHKKMIRLYYNYKVGELVMLRNKASYKYDIPY